LRDQKNSEEIENLLGKSALTFHDNASPSEKPTMQGKLIALLRSLSCKPTIFTLHDEKRKDKSRNMLSLQDPGGNNTQSLPIKLQLNQTTY